MLVYVLRTTIKRFQFDIVQIDISQASKHFLDFLCSGFLCCVYTRLVSSKKTKNKKTKNKKRTKTNKQTKKKENVKRDVGINDFLGSKNCRRDHKPKRQQKSSPNLSGEQQARKKKCTHWNRPTTSISTSRASQFAQKLFEVVAVQNCDKFSTRNSSRNIDDKNFSLAKQAKGYKRAQRTKIKDKKES